MCAARAGHPIIRISGNPDAHSDQSDGATNRCLVLADGSCVGYAEVGDPAGYPTLHMHGTPSSRLETTIPAVRGAADNEIRRDAVPL